MNIKNHNKFLAHIGVFTAVFVSIAAIAAPVLADHDKKIALKNRGYINLLTGNVIEDLIEMKRVKFNPIDGKETEFDDDLNWQKNTRFVKWPDTVGRDPKKFGNVFAKKVRYPEGGFHGALDQPDPNFLKYVVDFTIDEAVSKMVTLGMDDLGQASKWYLKAYEDLSDNAAAKVVKKQKWLAGEMIGQLPSVSSLIHGQLKNDLVPLPICQAKFKDPVTHDWNVIPGVVEGDSKLHQKRCIFVSMDGKSIHKTPYFNYLKLKGTSQTWAATNVLHWVRLGDFKDTNTPFEQYVYGGNAGAAKQPLYVCSRGYFNPRTKRCTGVKKNDDGSWEIVTDTSAANKTADSKSDMRVLRYVRTMHNKRVGGHLAPPDTVLMISDTEDRSTGRGFCMTVTGASKLVQKLPCSGLLEQKWRMNYYGEFVSEAYPKSDKKRCMQPKPFKKGEEFAFAKLDTCATNAALNKVAKTNMGHGVVYSQYFLRRQGARMSKDKKMLTARLCHRSSPDICAEFSFMEAFTDTGLPYLTKDKKNPKVLSGMFWYPYQSNVNGLNLPDNIVQLGRTMRRPTGVCRTLFFNKGGEHQYMNGHLVRDRKNKYWSCLYVKPLGGDSYKETLAHTFDILVSSKAKKIPYLKWVQQPDKTFATAASGDEAFSSRGYNTRVGVGVCKIRAGGQTLLGSVALRGSVCLVPTGGFGKGQSRILTQRHEVLTVSLKKKGTPAVLPKDPLKSAPIVPFGLRIENTGLCLEGNGDAKSKYWLKATPCKAKPASNDPQQFADDYAPNGLSYRLIDRAKKNCLAPSGNQTGKGVVIQSAKCSSHNAQYWMIEANKDTEPGWYRVRNFHSNKCIHLVKDPKGNYFTQWDCLKKEAMQRFKFVN